MTNYDAGKTDDSVRAWKVGERLHQRGSNYNHMCKVKSVVFTEAGLSRA